MEVTDEDMILLIELTQKPQYTGAVSSVNPFDDGTMPAFKKIGFAILEVNEDWSGVVFYCKVCSLLEVNGKYKFMNFL